VDDAPAFERSLRQKSAATYGRGYRAHSEEQNIAATPTTQELGSHSLHLRRLFRKEACGLL